MLEEDNTSVPTINSMLEGFGSDELKIYRVGDTTIIGETHIVDKEVTDIEPIVNGHVDDASVVFLEFDPDSQLADNYREVTKSDSAMTTAKMEAEKQGKEVVILDDAIPGYIPRLVQSGFTEEEAYTLFSLYAGALFSLRTNTDPTENINQLLRNLKVSEDTCNKISYRVGFEVRKLARDGVDSDEYNLNDFLDDFMHYDPYIRNYLYADLINRHSKGEGQKSLAVVGELHAKPMADILRGEKPELDGFQETRERLRVFLSFNNY